MIDVADIMKTPFKPLGTSFPRDKCYCSEAGLCVSHAFLFQKMLGMVEESASAQMVEITRFIEPHHLGALGRWMNAEEIISHIRHLEEPEQAHD